MTQDKLDGPIFGGAYIRKVKHFNLQSVKLTFLSFLQYKARYFDIFHVVQDVKYVQS